jgi:hypothetical protein
VSDIATNLTRGPLIVYTQEKARYYGILGGHFKTGNLWTVKTGNYLTPAKTNEFYFEPSSVRKSVCTFVRQLRGPHLSTCA